MKLGVIVRRTCKQGRKEFEFGYRRGRPRERCFTCQPLGTRVVKAVNGLPTSKYVEASYCFWRGWLKSPG